MMLIYASNTKITECFYYIKQLNDKIVKKILAGFNKLVFSVLFFRTVLKIFFVYFLLKNKTM